MNWDDVRIFLAIQRAGTLRGAAQQLVIDQTTVSRRLTGLERALGSRLFLRTTGGLVLTDTGHDGALRVLSELRALFSNLTLPHLPAGVRIGFSTGIAQAHPSDSADSLWQRADQGVYRAKAGGRGHDVFVPHPGP